MNATYRATRQGETTGVKFEARTVRAAKAQASRLLEGGAFPGQRITLATDWNAWSKPAGGRWDH